MPQTGQRADFVRDFNFLVEIDNIAQASFTDCTGVGTTTEVIEIRQGGDNTTGHEVPGQDQLHGHHPEVGDDRFHRAVGLAAADHRRPGGAARTARSSPST